jgi:hypothetical protein
MLSFKGIPIIYNGIISNKEAKFFQLIVKLHNLTTEKFAFRLDLVSRQQTEDKLVHTEHYGTNADGTTSLSTNCLPSP